MTDGAPENDDWLKQRVDRSPLLPEPALRRHWRMVIPSLPVPMRYELAAILVEIEHKLVCN